MQIQQKEACIDGNIMTEDRSTMESEEIDHYGGCHCGSIKFKVIAPIAPIIVQCKYVF